ncbi:MAG: hypothetical protein ABJD68_17355 [Nakamurella sp.]
MTLDHGQGWRNRRKLSLRVAERNKFSPEGRELIQDSSFGGDDCSPMLDGGQLARTLDEWI